VARIDTGTEELLCAVADGVGTITLNRPEKRNALSDALTPALRESLLTLERDPMVRCVVITGAGTAFCAGGDVSRMGGGAQDSSSAPTPAAPTVEDAARTLKHRQETLTLRLFELAKPTIASLPGAAAGAGFSIALACDLRIAAQSAFVTTAFANIGLSGDYGASWFLTRLVGSARAKELFFTARRVAAAEALALGIFNEVVADGELRGRTAQLAKAIASGPPIALRYMKENLNRAVDADLRTCLAMEADRMARSARTDDHKEAVQAFLGKRKPSFTGR
jgi:2-(1,2-epoxy-1,2-dihydrophenyl)acetyl-CoA isomerase